MSVGHTNGEIDERELQALEGVERSGDGTISFARAHSAEQEMLRGGEDLVFDQQHLVSPRFELLESAAAVPAILRGWAIVPLDDRILVEYASFREGYVCEECDGKGFSPEFICDRCQGIQKVAPRPGWKLEDCPDCRIVGAEGKEPSSCGRKPCQACAGSGLARGILAVPDASKQDHSYGDIVAVGAAIRDLRNGDRVLFSKMAGIYIRGDKNCCLLRRGEVMGYMRKA